MMMKKGVGFGVAGIDFEWAQTEDMPGAVFGQTID
jgi:hypothetical protein